MPICLYVSEMLLPIKLQARRWTNLELGCKYITPTSFAKIAIENRRAQHAFKLLCGSSKSGLKMVEESVLLSKYETLPHK